MSRFCFDDIIAIAGLASSAQFVQKPLLEQGLAYLKEMVVWAAIMASACWRGLQPLVYGQLTSMSSCPTQFLVQVDILHLPLFKVTKPEPSPHVCGHSWSCWRRDKLPGNFLESPVSKVNLNIYLQ